MATTNRVVVVESGSVVVRVEGPDSLRAIEGLVGRLLSGLSDSAGRLPIGFQSGSTVHLERSPETDA